MIMRQTAGRAGAGCAEPCHSSLQLHPGPDDGRAHRVERAEQGVRPAASATIRAGPSRAVQYRAVSCRAGPGGAFTHRSVGAAARRRPSQATVRARPSAVPDPSQQPAHRAQASSQQGAGCSRCSQWSQCQPYTMTVQTPREQAAALACHSDLSRAGPGRDPAARARTGPPTHRPPESAQTVRVVAGRAQPRQD